MYIDKCFYFIIFVHVFEQTIVFCLCKIRKFRWRTIARNLQRSVSHNLPELKRLTTHHKHVHTYILPVLSGILMHRITSPK